MEFLQTHNGKIAENSHNIQFMQRKKFYEQIIPDELECVREGRRDDVDFSIVWDWNDLLCVELNWINYGQTREVFLHLKYPLT